MVYIGCKDLMDTDGIRYAIAVIRHIPLDQIGACL